MSDVSPELAAEGQRALTPTGRAAQLDRSGLRPGWTTGACAAAAATSAYLALLTGEFTDPVTITLPGDRAAGFALTQSSMLADAAMAAVQKDAGDDPDVTHGAVIRATVRLTTDGQVRFVGGAGVGQVTLPGLPIAVGEPAINPMPREYIEANLRAAAAALGRSFDGAEVTISVDNGEQIAEKTWNPRIGIVGGISILGTTGVVVPYSCSAWIASIHEGIDVARATGKQHVAGATGSTSEATVVGLYPEVEILDMGDFAGAVLKYLKSHPIPRLTICGGVAKLSKLAQGFLDLHSHRTQIDPSYLAELAEAAGASLELTAQIREVATVAAAVKLCAAADINLPAIIATNARQTCCDVLAGAPVAVEIIVTDRAGGILARA